MVPLYIFALNYEKTMSKDYRYHREEWDSVEEGDNHGRKGQERRHQVKTKQKRDVQRREKQRRLHQESYW